MLSVESCQHIIQHGQQPLVVKIGSSLLVRGEQARADWVDQLITMLCSRTGPVIIVSSGAIALGQFALGESAVGQSSRPQALAEAQAAAAVGQIRLAQLWSEAWRRQGRNAAQLLLTLGDLEDRGRYLNARNTLETLLGQGVVPIINENDTVATGEIRFGDNDRLAARVAQLAQAELLVLLSDVDGVFDVNPTRHRDARLIREVTQIDASIEQLADDSAERGVGTGGMQSKLMAARIATAAGCPVLLTSGVGNDEPFARFFASARGTRFPSSEQPQVLRKQWLASLQQRSGTVHVDAGALAALRNGGSVLAAGVTGIEGSFERGALVALHGPDGPIGQGLCGYAADEAMRLIGLQSHAFKSALGYGGRGPVVHRDDLVLFGA
ncbi:MAG: glutamate 5-kinase [Pseudomonadota bacterium]